MKGFDKLHIKSAVKARNKIDLTFTHQCTFEFGQIIPLLFIETVPGDSFSVRAEYFSRLAPVVKPTYGDFSFHTVTGFVPYYQLADDFEAWRIGKLSWEGETPASRWIKMKDYVDFIISCHDVVSIPSGCTADNEGHFVDSSGQIQGTYDFVYKNVGGSLVYMKVSTTDPQAKYQLKVLNALGYSIPQNVDYGLTSDWYRYYVTGNKKLSALNLLAFAKMYNDWISQSQRYNTSTLTAFLKAVKHNKSVSGYDTTNHCISNTGIDFLTNSILLCYENDYFTSAWASANSPLGGVDLMNSMDAQSLGASITYDPGDNFITQNSPNTNKLGQRALDLLKSFSDFIRRRNYAGSKEVQQVYAVTGVKPEDYRSNYSHILDTAKYPIQFGDVTSTSQTTGADLGDYAGKGIMGSQEVFNYNASDYGCLFVLGWYTVRPINPYGFDRSVLRVDPLDFFNSEFDGVGPDAISVGEYFTNPLCFGGAEDNDTYGFTERYNSYRFGRDRLTGDFRNLHLDSEMNVWHSARMLNDVRASGYMVAQDSSVVHLPNHDSEYNRIFSVTDSSIDHFYSTTKFYVSAMRNMKSLNQVVDLGSGSTVVSRNGNEIS